MILYWVVPYLLVAAPFVIVLFAIVLSGCAMTRTAGDQAYQSRFYSDPNDKIGQELLNELKRREARAELRHIIDEAQR